jgi:hypothetical protein
MATFDSLHAARNDAEGEYGGVMGLIQPRSRGHNIDAPDHVQEKALIMRFEGLRSAQVMEDLDPTDEHYAAVAELLAKRAETLGEWSIEDALT